MTSRTRRGEEGQPQSNFLMQILTVHLLQLASCWVGWAASAKTHGGRKAQGTESITVDSVPECGQGVGDKAGRVSWGRVFENSRMLRSLRKMIPKCAITICISAPLTS